MLTRFALRLPITTFMIFIGILILGIISFLHLPVSLLPEIEFPEITVVTEYQNASSAEMENLVTKQIEEAVSTVSGVKEVSSVSAEGISLVRIRFVWGRNMDFAAMEVREKVDLIKGTMPQDVRKPIVLKFNPSDTPIMSFSVSSPYYNSLQLRHVVEKEIIPYLQRVDGTASVAITGGLIREIRINIDMAKLAARELSLQEVIDALNMANYNYPAGSVKKGDREYMVRVIGEFADIDEVKDLVIVSGEGGKSVLLKDIAEVKDAFRDRTASSHFNGKEDINLAIQKESLKNTVEVAGRLDQALKDIRQKFKGRIGLNVIYSQAEFIKRSNINLLMAALIGGVMAFLVILLFLQNLKDSFIIAISIPISVLTVFIFMYMMHISLNMISMGGIAMGIGMLVDDSIVVLESIARKLKLKKPDESDEDMILTGVKEVSASVTGSTLTSVIVFLPLIFVKGIAGAVFGQLAFTISVALLGSLFVSMTLIPLLYSLKIPLRSEVSFFPAFTGFFERFKLAYSGFLRKNVWNRRRVVLSGPLILLAGLVLLLCVKRELLPYVDSGKLRIRMEAPEGTPLETTEKFASIIEQQVLKNNKTASVFSSIGFDDKNAAQNQTGKVRINTAMINVILKGKGTEKFMDEIRRTLFVPIPLKLTFLNTQEILPGIAGGQEKNWYVSITGRELPEIRRISSELIDFFSKKKAIKDIENESGTTAPELKLVLDREAMSSLGLNVRLVAETLQAAIKGRRATFFRTGDDEYDIQVRLREEDRLDRTFLERIFIKNGVYGINIPLSSFARLEQEQGESSIMRINQQRSMLVSFNSTASRRVISDLISTFKNMKKWPPGYEIGLSGLDRETKSSMNSLLFAFLLSIVLVYMMLASQFESLKKPLIIMFSVPLLIPGVAVGLLIAGKTLNIISAIGLVMLTGVVVKNAIILFEFFEVMKKGRKDLVDSVIDACSIRLRPILMTTLTAILGLLPLLLAPGSGSEMESPMAMAVLSGFMFSSFLTLLYIPLLYIISEKHPEKKEG